jgi:CHAT domain-containing protein/tetratricopeptide (TPR) repeat protein
MRTLALACAFVAASVCGGAVAVAAQAFRDPVPVAAVTADLPAMVHRGFDLYDRHEYDAARQQFEQALTRAREDQNAEAEAEAHRGLGLIFLQKAAYPESQRELDRALALVTGPSGRALAEEALGQLALAMGEWPQARTRLHAALSEFEAEGNLQKQARVRFSLTFDPMLGFDEKASLRQKAEALTIESGDKELQGNILQEWADQEFVHGDFSSAIEKLESAIALFEKAGARRSLARALTSLGRLQRAHGHSEQAQALYRRALDIQREVGDQQGVIQSINAIAVADDALGRHAEAIEGYEQALGLARKTESPRLIAFAEGNLAGAYVDLGDDDRAVGMLEEVISLEKAPYLLAYRYASLSKAYLHLGRYRESREAADRGIALTRAQNDLERLPDRLDGRAKAREKLGEGHQALADEREALHVIEQLRARLVPTDFMKQGFAAETQDIFTSTIELLQSAGDGAQALEAAEQARARAFLDLLATREAPRADADRSEQTAASSTPASAPVSAAAAALTLRGGGSPGGASRTIAALDSSASAAPFSAGDVVATARRLHSTLLTYYVAPDATFIWVVTPSAIVQTARVNISADRLKALIARTRPEGGYASRGGVASAPGEAAPDRSAVDAGPSLQTRGGDVFFFGDSQQSTWQELYRLLIRPVRTHLPAAAGSRLTIIPHGPLFLLSFAALQDESGRYLLEKYALHYAPAAALLAFTNTEHLRERGARPRYLLVADPADVPSQPGNQPLAALPGADREVHAIASLVPASQLTVLTGSQATERTVRDRMRDATVIHLATHGIIRDDDPLGSFLALGRNGSGGDDDGRLTAAKIYDLHLHADVVVLSACRTALGSISGDGIAGLTRAFFYAGTPSVVATMWDVADEPTFRLVPEFYRALLAGQDKASALRTAQLKLLRALRAGKLTIAASGHTFTLPDHPFFWAGFVLLGEP